MQDQTEGLMPRHTRLATWQSQAPSEASREHGSDQRGRWKAGARGTSGWAAELAVATDGMHSAWLDGRLRPITSEAWPEGYTI